MTALTTITEEAKKLIEKVFLKTSFLIVLLVLFEIAQLFPIIQCNWCASAFPFILYFKTPNPYTTYTVTLAMLLLLSRTASFLWERYRKGLHKTFNEKEKVIIDKYNQRQKDWEEQRSEHYAKLSADKTELTYERDLYKKVMELCYKEINEYDLLTYIKDDIDECSALKVDIRKNNTTKHPYYEVIYYNSVIAYFKCEKNINFGTKSDGTKYNDITATDFLAQCEEEDITFAQL